MTEFSRSFHVRWCDMDFNAHMRNTAFLDVAGDVRMMYFASRGFTMRDFAAAGIGPVVTRDQLDYRRELHLLDAIEVDLELVGMAEDGSAFRLRNTVRRGDGKPAATIISDGGWLDLVKRRWTTPPPTLLAAMESLPRAADFAALPSKVVE